MAAPLPAGSDAIGGCTRRCRASLDQLDDVGSFAEPSVLFGTVAVVVDPSTLPQSGRVVLVMLKDGRQLEGELLVLTGRFAIGDVVFVKREIETFEDGS